jgi:hypothetical protein
MKILQNRRLQIILWLVLYLAMIDVAVNIIFRFPSNPQKTPPSFLQGYFEYGRSIEGKFSAMINAAKLQTEPTLGYGWLTQKANDSLPQKADANHTLVAVYGMSHTKLLGEAMAKVNSKYLIRSITAPGAPVGWSYTAYDIDRKKHDAKVVILGIMTDNIALLGATSGAITYFDLGHPYTFPRYRVENGKLRQKYPPFFTEEGFLEYFSDRNKWQEYRNWLAENDKFYNAFLFTNSPTDYSALFRVIRRAYAEMAKKRITESIYSKNGFNLNSEEITILKAMIIEFAQSARAENKLPIIYIVNNEGRSDHLYRALQPALDEYKIQHLSSHIICPPDDPRVYLGINSHFTPEKDTELAKAMIKIIETEKMIVQ